jgi:hypothetical protein
VTVADAQEGQEMVKLSTARKHLTKVLKMVAYQTESDLVELIRPVTAALKMKDVLSFRWRCRIPRTSSPRRSNFG